MPQHIQLSSNPSVRICPVWIHCPSLLDYGFFHEDNINELSYIMNALYTKEQLSCTRKQREQSPKRERIYLLIADLYRVSDDFQFVKDHRNAIMSLYLRQLWRH